MKTPASCSATIFAHNVARTITDCLDSVLSQAPEPCAQVFVLINGSQDPTDELVRKYATKHPNVTAVRLSLADKANAWNHYVHKLSQTEDVHFFVDGDVSVIPGSFCALIEALQHAPEANAAGGLPVAGRDRVGWSKRMVEFGRLAGGLYALRGSFVSDLRNRGIRMPTGLIGEDLFLSCLVKNSLNRNGLFRSSPLLVFAPTAGFSFVPLALSRPKDWVTYARRLVRYRIRDYQLAMLLHDLTTSPELKLPPDVETLYRKTAELPGYYWRGRITPFDLLAVWKIRKIARNGVSASTHLSE